MTSRSTPHALAVCAALALVPLAGCGPEGGDASSKGGTSAAGQPSVPTESRAPDRGKGSKDPDDLNGDGHRDLVVPLTAKRDTNTVDGSDERVGAVYGSAKGLDPATRAAYGRGDLGLPEPAANPPVDAGRSESLSEKDVVTADLDGDGFSDVVSTVTVGENVEDGNINASPSVPHVTWGGPGGPGKGAKATPVRLPESASKLGVTSVVRGDFDGDGHHDLAGFAQNQSSMVLLYGPFTRGGEPKRADTSLPWTDGDLVADDIDPTGKARATSLLVHGISDGEQAPNTLHLARRGTGPSVEGRKLRGGNAHAFGDFDGDGQRDVAVGDDGSRNDEPGEGTEPGDVDGKLTVYPGSGGAPVAHELPEAPKGASTPYGPGPVAAADPDGDGRDGILVATYEGATLIDGDRRTQITRQGPEEADGEKTPKKWRHARPAGAADFDGDGKDELVMNWGSGTSFGLYGEQPTHWWITDGTTSRDKTSFMTAKFVTD
ncbi:hypothetical protein ABZ554_17120 [Streptomyces sp. NPDC020125]|uniref:hypothetical protein n=1 Tax=Streptomyces sp. NPDC020125 TaxID=3154593 RepID=UPI0033DD9288